MLDRGNYEKDRKGFVIRGDLIVNYHTNSIGEIDIFMIDQIMTFFEALEYVSFDTTSLDSNITISSSVSLAELASCGVPSDITIPRFLRIGSTSYFYNIRDDGYCTYDEYEFHEDGFEADPLLSLDNVSPIENLNVTRFRDADFTINTFEDILFIENIRYNPISEVWVKEIATALPMSLTQAGEAYHDISDIMEDIHILEAYVLTNQSINLLSLREDYQDEDVNNIWSEETIDVLGRDHDLIKKVRLKNAGDILDIIDDTLGRLGMFQ